MKKTMLTVVCMLSLATITNAQETPPTKPKGGNGQPKTEHHEAKKTVEQRAQKSVDELNKRTTLTEDQKPKVYDMALTRAKNVEAIREKYKAQPDAKEAAKKEMDVVRKTYHQSVKGILTAEQIKALKGKRKEGKAMKEKEKTPPTNADDLDLGDEKD